MVGMSFLPISALPQTNAEVRMSAVEAASTLAQVCNSLTRLYLQILIGIWITECINPYFSSLVADGKYPTAQNDIWSLGVILINLVCSRNPWRVACPTDDTFRLYSKRNGLLGDILPISTELNELLKRVFSLNPTHRISLKEFRESVVKMRQFGMSERDLVKANPIIKAAARAANEPAQPRKKNPSPTETFAKDLVPAYPQAYLSRAQAAAQQPVRPKRHLARFPSLDASSSTSTNDSSSTGPRTPPISGLDPIDTISDMDEEMADVRFTQETSYFSSSEAGARHMHAKQMQNGSGGGVGRQHGFLTSAFRKIRGLPGAPKPAPAVIS